jgi:hypothetical protein
MARRVNEIQWAAPDSPDSPPIRRIRRMSEHPAAKR